MFERFAIRTMAFGLSGFITLSILAALGNTADQRQTGLPGARGSRADPAGGDRTPSAQLNRAARSARPRQVGAQWRGPHRAPGDIAHGSSGQPRDCVSWSAAPRAAATEPQALLRDEAFAQARHVIDASEVFAVDDSMRDYLRRSWPLMRKQGRPKGLVDALYTRGELKLEYDASYTRNASQAFAARAGNCLSLVVMTAALAKELGLEVEFHSALSDETWSRSGTLLLRSGHINITLGRRTIDRPARRRPALLDHRFPAARRAARAAQRRAEGSHGGGDVHEQPRRRSAGP